MYSDFTRRRKGRQATTTDVNEAANLLSRSLAFEKAKDTSVLSLLACITRRSKRSRASFSLDIFCTHVPKTMGKSDSVILAVTRSRAFFPPGLLSAGAGNLWWTDFACAAVFTIVFAINYL